MDKHDGNVPQLLLILQRSALVHVLPYRFHQLSLISHTLIQIHIRRKTALLARW